MKNFSGFLFIILCISLSTVDSKAGSTYFSITGSACMNGSGLATGISPHLSLNCGRSSFSLGPNLLGHKRSISGLSTGYRYILTENYTKRLQLFLFANLFLHRSACLSKGRVALEQRMARDKSVDFSAFRFKAGEIYSGFGLRFIHNDRFSSACSAGLGLYVIDSRATICRNPYTDRIGSGLQFKAMVIYSIGKNRNSALRFRVKNWEGI